MNAGQIVTQMNQQLSVIKNLEELLAHDAKEKGAHNIKPGDVAALKKYVSEMRLACETASIMAVHYNIKTSKPAADTLKPIETPKPATVKKPVEEPKPVEPPVTTEPEDDDLGFLD